MDLRYSPEDEDFRRELRSWLAISIGVVAAKSRRISDEQGERVTCSAGIFADTPPGAAGCTKNRDRVTSCCHGTETSDCRPSAS